MSGKAHNFDVTAAVVRIVAVVAVAVVAAGAVAALS
jgi:phage shock protein PspC (stress-responsive transcriptional regulator)